MRLEIISDQPLHTNCQLCPDHLATRLVRYKLDGVMFRRFLCKDCRAWIHRQTDKCLPNGIRAIKSEGESR